MSQISGTKSIDVGSMFLMDLSVHDSELQTCDPGDTSTTTTTTTLIDEDTTTFPSSKRASRTTIHDLNHSLSNQSIAYHRQENQPEHLGNSLDRLASAIEGDVKYEATINEKNLSLVTIVEPQPPPEIVEHQSSSSSSSLSNESFVASSDNSLIASSYTASSEAEEEERGSTATREDSGVLDIKDLDGQFNSYDNENEQKFCHQNNQLHQEKPISNNITATNLINKSAHNNLRQNPKWPNRPTTNNNSNNNNNNNDHHHHHHHHNQSGHRNSSKRSMSASLPIEVPVRQMKKDINKSKMMNKNRTTSSKTDANKGSSAYRIHDNQSAATNQSTTDDFEYFLEQEYNENHHNHYPIDEYDEEHVRAEENPMKLFESIQALARSLHEDTELFGSLPPKRMLESPIRSLAFV